MHIRFWSSGHIQLKSVTGSFVPWMNNCFDSSDRSMLGTPQARIPCARQIRKLLYLLLPLPSNLQIWHFLLTLDSILPYFSSASKQHLCVVKLTSGSALVSKLTEPDLSLTNNLATASFGKVYSTPESASNPTTPASTAHFLSWLISFSAISLKNQRETTNSLVNLPRPSIAASKV